MKAAIIFLMIVVGAIIGSLLDKLNEVQMQDVIPWALARLREPSTYAGLAALLVAFHVADATSWATAIQTLAIGVAGVIAMVIKEKAQ